MDEVQLINQYALVKDPRRPNQAKWTSFLQTWLAVLALVGGDVRARRRGSWRADVSVEECSWELTSSSSRAACGRRDRSAALSLFAGARRSVTRLRRGLLTAEVYLRELSFPAR